MIPIPIERTDDLERVATDIRKDIVRMIAHAGSGHPGGSLSVVEILVVLWLSGVMNVNQDDFCWEQRDLFFLSKGHAAPALYSVFKQIGWLSEEDLMTLRRLGSKLQGHPDSRSCPGVEVCSGSLGQGLPVAVGSALGLKMHSSPDASYDRCAVCVVGDGELQEGSNWEALMFAAHRKLDNLLLVIDANGLELDEHVESECSLGDLAGKLCAFGWNVLEVDGHDVNALRNACRSWKLDRTGPTAIIARTVKGKGVSFMEGNVSWHGGTIGKDELELALHELELGTCVKGR